MYLYAKVDSLYPTRSRECSTVKQFVVSVPYGGFWLW